MTQTSYPWADIAIGDGSLSPYDDGEWSDIWRKLFQRDRTLQGHIEGHLNELAVTNPSSNDIQVDTGAALVDGKFYDNDAADTTAIATPSVSTRIDRVVLRKSWAAQTVRIAFLTGVEGAGVPSLTQTDGVTWEIPLAQVQITTGATITITDERIASRTPLAVEASSGDFFEIETIIADGTTAVIDFASIPQTYTHLLLIGQDVMDGAILEATREIRFNNDSGANYDDQATLGENLTASAAANAGATEGFVGQVVAASGVANHASSLKIHIPNYAGVTFYKNWTGMSSHIPGVTVAQFQTAHLGGVWADTSAINRITILSTTASAGNFLTGTTYTLYGMN